MPEARFHPRLLSRKVVGIFGATGTGKTQAARALSRTWRRRMAYDPECDLVAGEPGTGADVQVIARTRMELLDYLDGTKTSDIFSVAYQPDEPDDDDDEDTKDADGFDGREVGFMARCARTIGDCAVIIDEAADSCARGLVMRSTLKLSSRGRHQRIHLVLISQRPADIHPRLRAEAYAQEVYLFRLGRRADLDDLAKERGGKVAELVAALDDLHAIRIRGKSGGVEMRRVKVLVDGGHPRIVESGLVVEPE